MKFQHYAKDKLLSFLLLFICAMLSGALLDSLDIRPLFIIFAEVIFVSAFIVGMLYDFFRRSLYYNHILQTLNGLKQKSLFGEMIEPGNFIDAEIMLDIVRQSSKYMNDRISEIERANREYREYVEIWVHEIKTPIASAQLIVENDKNRATLRISDELQKIDHFVEQSLYYARSTALEKDFKVEDLSLKEICAAAVKAYSKSIIQAGGRVELSGLVSRIHADKKWCVFIVGQIITNAVKYRGESLAITFSEELHKDYTRLIIHDNGIGIPEGELARVFDKGFTGSNGRRYGKSTGIGLYLCNKLCLRMNMKISVESKENEGTSVILDFPGNRLLAFQNG